MSFDSTYDSTKSHRNDTTNYRMNSGRDSHSSDRHSDRHSHRHNKRPYKQKHRNKDKHSRQKHGKYDKSNNNNNFETNNNNSRHRKKSNVHERRSPRPSRSRRRYRRDSPVSHKSHSKESQNRSKYGRHYSKSPPNTRIRRGEIDNELKNEKSNAPRTYPKFKRSHQKPDESYPSWISSDDGNTGLNFEGAFSDACDDYRYFQPPRNDNRNNNNIMDFENSFNFDESTSDHDIIRRVNKACPSIRRGVWVKCEESGVYDELKLFLIDSDRHHINLHRKFCFAEIADADNNVLFSSRSSLISEYVTLSKERYIQLDMGHCNDDNRSKIHEIRLKYYDFGVDLDWPWSKWFALPTIPAVPMGNMDNNLVGGNLVSPVTEMKSYDSDSDSGNDSDSDSDEAGGMNGPMINRIQKDLSKFSKTLNKMQGIVTNVSFDGVDTMVGSKDSYEMSSLLNQFDAIDPQIDKLKKMAGNSSQTVAASFLVATQEFKDCESRIEEIEAELEKAKSKREALSKHAKEWGEYRDRIEDSYNTCCETHDRKERLKKNTVTMKKVLKDCETKWKEWKYDEICWWFRSTLTANENHNDGNENESKNDNDKIDWNMIKSILKKREICGIYLKIFDNSELKRLGFESDKDRDVLLKAINKLVEKQRKTDKNKSNKEEECVICLSNPKRRLCVPCGHECICQECSKQFNQNQGCPICRAPIERMIDFFR